MVVERSPGVCPEIFCVVQKMMYLSRKNMNKIAELFLTKSVPVDVSGQLHTLHHTMKKCLKRENTSLKEDMILEKMKNDTISCQIMSGNSIKRVV